MALALEVRMNAKHMDEDYALAIRAIAPEVMTPMVYDLTGEAIDIGASDENHIVLSGPGVEPFHLAVRRLDSELYLLTDWSLVRKQNGPYWHIRPDDDMLLCARHGQVDKLLSTGFCPLCGQYNGSIWLLRRIGAGEAFPIGDQFEGTVLRQRTHNRAPRGSQAATHIPWPDNAWLQNPPGRPGKLDIRLTPHIREQQYPLDDSNLWMWSALGSPFPVFLHQRVNHSMTRHAHLNRDREVGGILLGEIHREPAEGIVYPVITQSLPAHFAVESRGHLTFTRETWLELHRKREEQFPDLEIVGWYHTHPGLDIFLSAWDLFIHNHFFNQPWQIALVIDPHQQAAGIFVWNNGEIVDPQRPHEPFRVAELEQAQADGRRVRVRITLKEAARTS